MRWGRGAANGLGRTTGYRRSRQWALLNLAVVPVPLSFIVMLGRLPSTPRSLGSDAAAGYVWQYNVTACWDGWDARCGAVVLHGILTATARIPYHSAGDERKAEKLQVHSYQCGPRPTSGLNCIVQVSPGSGTRGPKDQMMTDEREREEERDGDGEGDAVRTFPLQVIKYQVPSTLGHPHSACTTSVPSVWKWHKLSPLAQASYVLQEAIHSIQVE